MIFLHETKRIFKKVIKGTMALFIIQLLIVCVSFLIQSCQSDSLENKTLSNAKDDLIEHFSSYKTKINDIAVINLSNNPEKKFSKNDKEKFQTFYLASNNNSNISLNTTAGATNQINTLSDLVNVMDTHELHVSYEQEEPGSNQIPFQISENEILNSLNSTIPEAKQYLNTLGLTNEDISSMIEEHNGQEIDIITFALSLASIQKENIIALNFSDVFFSSAYAQSWREIGKCAMIAVGADILYSLGTQDVTKWSAKTLKKAFGKVAKRLLGPIGAAIAVVSFGICILEATLADGNPVYNVTCYDLLAVKTENSLQTYYISKEEFNFKSRTGSLILSSSFYRTYNLNFGDIQNPSCNITHSNHKLLGRTIDISSIKEVTIPDPVILVPAL